MHLLDGALSHAMLEAAGVADTGAVILEERLFAELAGVTLSGAMDCALIYPTGKIVDYKKTSVWKLLMGSVSEWTQQLNIYAWLSAQNERSIVTELEIAAWLRDWKAAEALRGVARGYPPRGIMTLPIELWPLARTEAFIHSRIQEHVSADECLEQGGDDCLPFCTDDERWIRNKKWAVMKPGRKSAVRVIDERAEADLLAESLEGGWVEQRGGAPTRCMSWCDAGKAGLCSQYNAERALYEGATNAAESGSLTEEVV
jgi:hypothetical protein